MFSTINLRKRKGLFLTIPVLILSLLFAATVFAQSFTFSAVTIQGNQRIETGTISNYVGIDAGETVSAGEVNDGLQRLRATGLFESVDADIVGTQLVITVVEYPTINAIFFEGNKRIKSSELQEVVRSSPRRVFNPALVQEDVLAIGQLYTEKGRINATVSPKRIERADNRVDLVFEIFEGGLTEIESISFVGNRSFSDARLRRVLASKQATVFRALVRRDTFVEERIGFDRRVLSDFYMSRGFIDFKIQSVDVTLTQERDAYLIIFNIEEGQQYTFGDVTVTSEIAEANAAEFQRFLKNRKGAVYTPIAIENDILRLENEASRQGINFLRATPDLSRDYENLRVNVNYVLERGERLFVERIDIEGNTTTEDRVVRNQFILVEGDPFDPRAVRASAERIRALGYFSNAEIEARPGSTPDQVVIDVNVQEQPTGDLRFGANYNSADGPSLILSYSEKNFLGRGQEFDVSLSTARTNRKASLSFVEPNLLGRNLLGGISLSYSRTDNENARYDTERFRFSPTLGFPVTENASLNVFYAANYTDIFDVTSESLPIVADGEIGGIWNHSVGYRYTYDNRRSGYDPDISAFLRFGQELGLGDSQYLETSVLASLSTDVFKDEVTLRGTFEAGNLSYSSGRSRITDRYFMPSSVMRGFAPHGIGPRDAETGEALGGNTFAVLRLEAEFPIGLPEEYGISAGVFYDYGSLWNTGLADDFSVEGDDFAARSVLGASIFWTTPLGPLRFNWTRALDAQDADIEKNFEVTISTQF